MKTKLLKRLRKKADNLYIIFPTCKTHNNQMKIIWQVSRLLGMDEIVYFESDDEFEANMIYEAFKREYILYQAKYLRNKKLRKL